MNQVNYNNKKYEKMYKNVTKIYLVQVLINCNSISVLRCRGVFTVNIAMMMC